MPRQQNSRKSELIADFGWRCPLRVSGKVAEWIRSSRSGHAGERLPGLRQIWWGFVYVNTDRNMTLIGIPVTSLLY
jgi:hypothetical protein